jgi:hypothetical protein
VHASDFLARSHFDQHIFEARAVAFDRHATRGGRICDETGRGEADVALRRSLPNVSRPSQPSGRRPSRWTCYGKRSRLDRSDDTPLVPVVEPRMSHADQVCFSRPSRIPSDVLPTWAKLPIERPRALAGDHPVCPRGQTPCPDR